MRQTTFFSHRQWAPQWYCFDAQGQTLGRLCSQIAVVLQGKHDPRYVFHHNMRCYVVVINAQHLQITKKKLQQNIYYSHSGYPGGLKQRRWQEVWQQKPTFPIMHTVRLMLPKNRLAKQQLRQLYVYPTAQHPHTAQKLQTVKLYS